MYDPATNEWSPLPDMNFGRISPAVAVVDNRLYVFGGCSELPEMPIEYFDFEKNEWFVLETKVPDRPNGFATYYMAAYFDNIGYIGE